MNTKNMVLASFAGDSLALGPHWIYKIEEIKQAFGKVEKLEKPLLTSYHPNKDKGDFTHYGDQTFVLLQSLAAKRGFDLNDFAEHWKKLFENYNDYLDHATKETTENFAAGKNPTESGSDSTDLSVAGRIAPLVCLYKDDLDKLREAAVSQTKMTHNTTECVDATTFFATVTYMVLHGKSPVDALKQVAGGSSAFVKESVAKGLATVKQDTNEAIQQLGPACAASGAFPSTVHLIAKYSALKEALIACVNAGGDSAARALIVGMVLGAQEGQTVPEEWVHGMKRGEEIKKLLEEL